MSENQLSRTSSCDENVKLSELVTTSTITGMLTPPMSIKSLEGNELSSSKEAKKAAKLQKKKEKKAQKNNSESNKLSNPSKSTLNDQIFQSCVDQLRVQSAIPKELIDDSQLIQKLIGFDGHLKLDSIASCEKPLPPLPSEGTSLLTSSIRKLHAAYSITLLDSKDESESINRIVSQYGRTTHMGVLDPSYKYFLNEHHTGAIYYKVHNHVAVIAGDPLCAKYQIDNLLNEFQKFRNKMGLDMAFMGASDSFAQYARRRNWTTMHFGWDRILNPTTNALLNEQNNGIPQPSSTKRMLTQNRSLLNPAKGNLEIGIYLPSLGQNDILQEQLRTIYDDWRHDRNEKRANTTQAFITVYDPFSLPKMMVYIYTRDKLSGKPNGFAALRKLGAHKGYQLDPCIAAPECELRGISDLLVYTSLVLLFHAKVDYMSFGIEPIDELGEIVGMPYAIEKITRNLYKRAFANLPLSGKKAFHDKFRPEESVNAQRLHIIFPGTITNPRYGLALAHMANVSLRKVLFKTAPKNCPPLTLEEENETEIKEKN